MGCGRMMGWGFVGRVVFGWCDFMQDVKSQPGISCMTMQRRV
jgi:hypothetical protein